MDLHFKSGWGTENRQWAVDGDLRTCCLPFDFATILICAGPDVFVI